MRNRVREREREREKGRERERRRKRKRETDTEVERESLRIMDVLPEIVPIKTKKYGEIERGKDSERKRQLVCVCV